MRTLNIYMDSDAMAALENAGQNFVAAGEKGEYAGETLSFESPAAVQGAYPGALRGIGGPSESRP